ncbi:MAG: Cna B-type domain-containing protein, partial [Lachnospiraceae bacterium]|nr:Cna B-type domain-containing protein [Lachnospiraceae bacterium]
GYVTTVSGTTGTSNVTSGTISEDTVAVAEFTNTRNTYGNLTVKKTVVGNAADTNKEFNFKVTLSDKSINGLYGDMTFSNGVATFKLKHDESWTANSLPTGVSYTVEEEDYTAAGYTTKKTGETGTITGGCNLTAAFENTRNAEGSLTISKTLAGNDTDKSKDFTFTIKLNDSGINGTYSGVVFTNGEANLILKGGENKVIEGLPNGVGYTITESDYSGDGYVTTVSGTTGTNREVSGVISEAESFVAAFTNTKDTYGKLTVSKTVAGNEADLEKEFSFTVTLDNSLINGLYGEMTFSDGVATFTLKHDESKTAENLPTGVSYTVTETDYTADGYVTTKSDDTGTITAGCDLTAAFTNTYVPAPISVSGKKTWDDNNNEYGERPEEITINLLADGEKIESKKVTEADNWSWSFTDLPKYSENGNEITYTISEEDIKHYTANVTGFDVTNKYTPEETEVKVTKVWEDNGDEDGIRPAKIMVQLYEDRLFDKKVGDPVELSVENGWTYVWTKLPRTKLFSNINYTVKELGAVDAEGKVIDIEGYTCTISEDTTNNIVITNSHEPTPKPTPTPTATATPSATSTSTPTVTPTATPSETPTATPSATPAETPSATPEVTPERTPDNTPEATPDSTPEATPETTPESTPVPSETPAATEAPTETPAPADEPETPDDGPERTPETRPENTPAPTPVRQVLGANRVRIRASEGAVLGARRGLDCAVLGKRRRPGTGDSASIIMWVLMMSAAVGGVLTSIIMLITGRKRKNS